MRDCRVSDSCGIEAVRGGIVTVAKESSRRARMAAYSSSEIRPLFRALLSSTSRSVKERLILKSVNEKDEIRIYSNMRENG